MLQDGIEKDTKEHIQEYHTVEPLPQILAKAQSFGSYYLDHITCIFEKRLIHANPKNAFFKNSPKLLIAEASL